MEFYGFDVAKYWTGFTNEHELFDWATSGRFFSREIFDSRTEKSNDRSRQAKRPMYRRFVEEYMPAHLSKGAENIWTRHQVLQEALDSFDKQADYNAMLEEHHSKEAEEGLMERHSSNLASRGQLAELGPERSEALGRI